MCAREECQGFRFTGPGTAQGDPWPTSSLIPARKTTSVQIPVRHDAIHPTKDEPTWEAAPQIYINPVECLDCGACVAECPSDSIFSADELPADKADAAEKNAEFFK